MVYALILIARRGRWLKAALEINADIREINATLSSANETLSFQNEALVKRLEELQRAKRELREKYEEVIQELVDHADSDSLLDVVNDRLRELSEMSTKDDN